MTNKNIISQLEEKLYHGFLLSKEDALKLSEADYENLCAAAHPQTFLRR